MKDMIEIPRIVLDDWLQELSKETIDHDGYNNESVIYVRDQIAYILKRHDAASSEDQK